MNQKAKKIQVKERGNVHKFVRVNIYHHDIGFIEFNNIIQEIIQQQEWDDKAAKHLDFFNGDSQTIFHTNLIDSVVIFLADSFHCWWGCDHRYDYNDISWWLFEKDNKNNNMMITLGKYRKVEIRTTAQLYLYLVKNHNLKRKAIWTN